VNEIIIRDSGWDSNPSFAGAHFVEVRCMGFTLFSMAYTKENRSSVLKIVSDHLPGLLLAAAELRRLNRP
jgi:hypothetical protein